MPLAYSVLSQLLEDRFTSIVCADNAGCMRGRLMLGYNIPLFEAFMGIPYALPPVGNLRFSVSIMSRLCIERRQVLKCKKLK